MCLDCMDGAYEADEECRSQYNCCSFEETLADDDDDDYDDGDDNDQDDGDEGDEECHSQYYCCSFEETVATTLGTTQALLWLGFASFSQNVEARMIAKVVFKMIIIKVMQSIWGPSNAHTYYILIMMIVTLTDPSSMIIIHITYYSLSSKEHHLIQAAFLAPLNAQTKTLF